MAPPEPAATEAPWSTITWRKLDPADAIVSFVKVVTTPAGFLARGERIATDNGSRTPLWTSSDGKAWQPLGAATLGANGVVIGVYHIGGLMTALTLSGDENLCPETASPFCWQTRPPLRAWISADGLNWTFRAEPMHLGLGPDRSLIRLPASAATSRAIIVTHQIGDEDGVAISRDGATWQGADAPPAFGTGSADGLVAVADRFVATGAVGGPGSDTPFITWSDDGLTWQPASVVPPGERDLAQLVVGRGGVIVQAVMDGASWEWWSSSDGDAWTVVDDFSPLGPMAAFEQMPDGELVGNGERMIAYRWDGTRAWTSFDGVNWSAVGLDGDPPPQLMAGGLRLLHTGLLYTEERGAWFGDPAAD